MSRSETQRVSIVVPVTDAHYKYLPRLLRNLRDSACLPIEVIIAPSGRVAPVVNLQADLPFQLEVLPLVPHAFAGENRNRGWERAQGGIVMFCDADDVYSPRRSTGVLQVFDSMDADLVYHTFRFMAPQWLYTSLDTGSGSVVGPEQVRSANPFASSVSPANLARGAANIQVPRIAGRQIRVHHGHVSVRKEVPLRFGPEPYGEDGLFAQRCIAAGLRVCVLDHPLSLYTPLSLGNAARFLQSRAVHLGSRVRSSLH